MAAFRVVEHLDVIEDIPLGLFAISVDPPSNSFPLEKLEEALSDRVVVAVAASAHALLQVVNAEIGDRPRFYSQG